MDVLIWSMMNASFVERIPVDEQLQSLMSVVQQLRQEFGELRCENAELRQQVSELRCDVGYWKSLHARAVERNANLQAELDQSKAGIRQLLTSRSLCRAARWALRLNESVEPQSVVRIRNTVIGNVPRRLAPQFAQSASTGGRGVRMAVSCRSRL